MLKQELDHAQAQKLTQFQHIKKIEANNSKLKDALGGLLDSIRARRGVYRDMREDQAGDFGDKFTDCEEILAEFHRMDLDSNLIELPPCSIQTTVFKPF